MLSQYTQVPTLIAAWTTGFSSIIIVIIMMMIVKCVCVYARVFWCKWAIFEQRRMKKSLLYKYSVHSFFLIPLLVIFFFSFCVLVLLLLLLELYAMKKTWLVYSFFLLLLFLQKRNERGQLWWCEWNSNRNVYRAYEWNKNSGFFSFS